mgnify:CR=1 FL=1
MGGQLQLYHLSANGAVETPLGFASFQCLESSRLFSRLGNAQLAAFIRRETGGRSSGR